jgi:hypothetical protein
MSLETAIKQLKLNVPYKFPQGETEITTFHTDRISKGNFDKTNITVTLKGGEMVTIAVSPSLLLKMLEAYDESEKTGVILKRSGHDMKTRYSVVSVKKIS